jgi:hypothetical protein
VKVIYIDGKIDDGNTYRGRHGYGIPVSEYIQQNVKDSETLRLIAEHAFKVLAVDPQVVPGNRWDKVQEV